MNSIETLPVMIIDDEEGILDLIAQQIKGFAPVETFSDPNKALERLKENDFSLVISDLSLGSINGLEILEECRKIQDNCQRVLITAFSDLINIENSINKAQLNGILSKPWEEKELTRIVSKALHQNRLSLENEELRRLAWTDALSGVANHRYLWERLESEVSRALRYERPLSLIMCDIDDFKAFNDQFGHLTGDKIIRDVAQILSEGRRQMDTVARYGGEEFCIILPEATLEQGINIAKRIQEEQQPKLSISLSFGVASLPQAGKTATELVHWADQALLNAKKAGKNCVVSFEELKSHKKDS